MKVTVQVTHLAGGRVIVVTVDRGARRADEGRWAAEERERYRMALEAIRESPESAGEIAESGLAG